MRWFLGAMVRAAAWALVVGVAAGVGDESTRINVVGLGAFECVQANFGAPFPHLGVKAPVATFQACTHAFLAPRDQILLVNMTAVTSIASCSAYGTVLNLSSRDIMGIQRTVPAVVAINWNEGAPFAMEAPASAGAQFRVVPTCMVSRRDGEIIAEYLASTERVTATIHDGGSEEVDVQVQDSSVEVYVDGARVTPGKDVIHDTYQQVAVHATEKGENPLFKLSVSDYFGTHSYAWRCSSSEPKDWNKKSYLAEFDRKTKWEDLMEVIEDTRTPTDDWTQSGSFIWTQSSAHELWCFGTKHLTSIVKFGYEYTRLKDPLAFKDAEQACGELGGALPSIHSRLEQEILASMLDEPSGSESSSAAWIGLNDRESEGHFRWSDGTAVDFLRWAPDHPLVKGDEFDCAKLVLRPLDAKDPEGPYMSHGRSVGVAWENVACGKNRVTVCKRFVGSREDETTSDDDDRCYLYMDTHGSGFSRIGVRPQMLRNVSSNLCLFGKDRRSCCSADYIAEQMADFTEALRSRVKTKTCMDVIEQINCFACMPTQGRYTSFNVRTGVTVNFCQDTCVTFYNSCKDDPAFKHLFEANGATAFSVCESFDGLHTEAGSDRFTIKVREADDEDCFRIDGMPPKVITRVPEPGAALLPGTFLVMTFDEQVRIIDGDVRFNRRTRDGEIGETVASVSLLDRSRVIMRKSTWDNDQIMVALPATILKEGKCLSPGEYEVVIPSMAIVDMAGNAYPGTSSELERWPVTVGFELCNKPPSGGARVGHVFLVLAVVGLLGAAAFFAVRRRRGGPGAGPGVDATHFLASIGETFSSASASLGERLSSFSGGATASGSFAPSLGASDQEAADASSSYVQLDPPSEGDQHARSSSSAPAAAAAAASDDAAPRGGDHDGDDGESSYSPPNRSSLLAV